MPSVAIKSRLGYGHIGSRRAFCPLLNLKRDAVTFIERLEAVRIDCVVMHKHIRSVFLLDESITFAVIEPTLTVPFVIISSSFQIISTLQN